MSSLNTQYNRDLYLSPDQQDLLLAALSSNKPQTNGLPDNPQMGQSRNSANSRSPQVGQQQSMGNGQLFDSPIQQTPGSGNFLDENSPFLDYEDADGNLDFDFSEAQMIGELPDGSNGSEEGDLHDKRKSIDGKTDDDEGGGKRRESDDKSAKKPGRKPLTSEPTSKRKAQNRAAQRAFRERKEKHLKDLETKVEDLEKTSESTNHENGLLKAQVERLTIELKEYRKRLSFIGSGGGGISRSPTAPSALSTTAKNNNHSDFQFEFPKFGDLPGAHIFNNGSFAKVQQDKNASKQSAPVANYSMPGVIGRNPPVSSSPRGKAPNYGSTGNSPVPIVNRTNTSSTQNYSTARKSVGIDGLQDLFSPSILESVSRNSSYDYISHPGSSTALNQTALAQNNANNANNANYQAQTNGSSSVSNTDSPSASSESQPGNVSSIGTSPEPSLNSPSTKLNEFGLNTINEEHSTRDIDGGETKFCKMLGLACGNSTNPVPRTMSLSNRRDPLGPAKTPASELNGIDWLAQQNGGQFDPVLFGGYRDPQDAVISQDFGSFFDDAFPLPDIGSPFNNYNAEITSPLPAPKRDLMKEIEETQNGAEEEVVPGEDRSKMLTCNKIWDRLQSIDLFQSGSLDIDGLCSQLTKKAKCSESGAVVGEKDVNDILRRMKASNATQAQANATKPL